MKWEGQGGRAKNNGDDGKEKMRRRRRRGRRRSGENKEEQNDIDKEKEKEKERGLSATGDTDQQHPPTHHVASDTRDGRWQHTHKRVRASTPAR